MQLGQEFKQSRWSRFGLPSLFLDLQVVACTLEDAQTGFRSNFVTKCFRKGAVIHSKLQNQGRDGRLSLTTTAF